MPRYIDADIAKDKFSPSQPICISIRQIIDEIPTADVVEVVRCKDCKYFKERENKAYKGHFCERIVDFVKPDDFCSYGERKPQEV